MWKKISKAGVLACGISLAVSSLAQGETLTETIDEVIKTNPQVQSQIYNRLARDQEVVQAKADYWPVIDGYLAGGYAEDQEPTQADRNPFEAGFQLRQNVFRGFATMGEVARQEARVDSQAYQIQGTSEDLALEASRVYLNVLRKQELKDIADENLAIHERIMDQVKMRSQSGVGSQADLDQITSRLSLAQSTVVIANTNLLDAESEYLAVVGHLPGDLTVPAAPTDMMPESLEDATLQALEANPILKSAGADLEAAEQQYEVAKSPYYPILDIELDQRWEDEISRIDSERDYWSAIGRVRYNFFRGFADQGRKAQTLEEVSEAREIKNNTERQVVESMRLSWRAYMAVLDRIDYLREYIRSSRATATAYAKQFDIGKRTLFDVLDAEAEAVTAQEDLVNAEFDGLNAQYRILATTGNLVNSFGLEWPEEAMVDGEQEMEESSEMEESAAVEETGEIVEENVSG